MKKLLFFFTVLTMGLLAQSWDIERTISGVLPSTNYNTVNAVVKDAALNIVASSTQGVFYYKVKPSGTVLTSIQLDTSPAEYVQISEELGQLHVLYKSGTTLKYKYSANGSSWATLNSSETIFSSSSNSGLKTIVEENIIRAVVAKESEVYYFEFDREDLTSLYSKNVTDYTQFTTVGNKPSLIKDNGKIYVGYIETTNTDDYSSGRLVSRNMNDATKAWSGMDTIPSNLQNKFPSTQNYAVIDDYLFAFFTQSVGDPEDLPPYGYVVKYSKRPLNGSTWTAPVQVGLGISELNSLKIVKTANGINNLLFNLWSSHNHFIVNGTGISAVSTTINFSNNNLQATIAAQNNELYIISKPHNTSGISYREYNYAPIQATGLTSSVGTGQHPFISWTASPEADVVGYNVYKDGQYIGYTTTNNYTDLAEVIVTGPATDNETIKKYKVKAVDIGSLLSPFSAELNVRIWQESLEKRGENGEENNATIPSIYSLGDNYPNPFNPTTRFNFSIAQEENVRITVYSMLGEPVGELVNERLAAGEYSLSFDASSLASGTYIYVIKAGSFTQSKKMVLMK